MACDQESCPSDEEPTVCTTCLFAECEQAFREGEETAQAEVKRLQAIVDRLPKDAEGNVYPPPRALQGKWFYHPEHLGPAVRLFTQLYWHPAGHWGVGSGGWEVPLAECYDTHKAAEAAADAAESRGKEN